MQTIKAIADTWLKKAPLQAAELELHEKVAVQAGTTYPVTEYKKANAGHYWVRLGYGAGDWYIYDAPQGGHWETSWEFEEKETETPSDEIVAGEIITTPGLIDWGNNAIRISEYFTVGEVTLGDARRKPKPESEEEIQILKLAKELDKIREDWGSAIVVTSWFRPSTRLGYPYDINASVGGAWNSQHIYGRAADIKPKKGDIFDFQVWVDADWYGALGYGANKGFIHVDSRNGLGWKTGGVKDVRWTY